MVVFFIIFFSIKFNEKFLMTFLLFSRSASTDQNIGGWTEYHERETRRCRGLQLQSIARVCPRTRYEKQSDKIESAA